eukprot:s2913_g8.t1
MEMLPEASSAPAEAAPSVPAEQSAPEGVKHSFEEVVLCGERVKLWKPTGAVSDTTLLLDLGEGTFLAMVKELKGLTQVKAGRVMKEKEALDFCKKNGIKVITCRWVTASKPEADEGVRARIVVKDFAKGKQTVRQEGISSPTPSIESLRILLGAASGEMSEVDYNPDVQTEVRAGVTEEHAATEVPPVPSGSPIVVEDIPKENEEPETPVPAPVPASSAVTSKPKVKAMPRRTTGKRTAVKGKAVAVKKMPRPAVKAVKQETSESGKHARQKDAMAYFKRQRQEEESRPAEIIAVERSGHGREIHRKVFNPASGKREVMNITVGDRSTEGGNTKKFITSFKGFSRRAVDELRCGHCGEVGHIISMCPQMSRRVSLTQSAVVLTPRTGLYETATPSEIEVPDTITPEDSISTVAGLTAESLRAHNRRLRGHSWDAPTPPPVASGETTEVKSGAAVAKGPKGRPPNEPRPPNFPPPGWKPPQAMPPPPPPIPINTTSKGEANAYWGSPSTSSSPTTGQSPSMEGTPRKGASVAPSTPPKSNAGKGSSPAVSPAKSSPVAEVPQPKLRTGPGGTLEVG